MKSSSLAGLDKAFIDLILAIAVRLADLSICLLFLLEFVMTVERCLEGYTCLMIQHGIRRCLSFSQG